MNDGQAMTVEGLVKHLQDLLARKGSAKVMGNAKVLIHLSDGRRHMKGILHFPQCFGQSDDELGAITTTVLFARLTDEYVEDENDDQ